MSNDVVEAIEERGGIQADDHQDRLRLAKKKRRNLPKKSDWIPDATEQSTCQIPSMSYHQDSQGSRKMGVIWNSGRDMKRRRELGGTETQDDRKRLLGLIGDNSVVEDNSLVQGNDNRRGSWGWSDCGAGDNSNVVNRGQ